MYPDSYYDQQNGKYGGRGYDDERGYPKDRNRGFDEYDQHKWSWWNLCCGLMSAACCLPLGCCACVCSILAYSDHKAKEHYLARRKRTCSYVLAAIATLFGVATLLLVICVNALQESNVEMRQAAILYFHPTNGAGWVIQTIWSPFAAIVNAIAYYVMLIRNYNSNGNGWQALATKAISDIQKVIG